MSQDKSRIGKLILVPAVITLAVTFLRLVGELQGWSPILFNRWTLVGRTRRGWGCARASGNAASGGGTLRRRRIR